MATWPRMPEPVHWLADGSPFSQRFGDTYRSRSGGLAQARTVFLGGCGLPTLWQGAGTFTLLETGFGLGLNFLATWAAWLSDPQRSALLRYQSIEAYPVAAADVLRSAQDNAVDPAVDAGWMARAHRLATAWPQATVAPGWHELVLHPGPVQFWLGLGDVRERLADVPHAANAVYLDGYAPACNPDMWSREVLTAAVHTCRAGARLASYTVARPVRNALEAAGATVSREPGLPPKRHRLEAWLP